MDRDRLGRRRGPDQERGLRPLHPLLPEDWESKVLRVAMSREDWARFESLVESVAPQAPTSARAHGMALSHLIETSAPAPRSATAPRSGPGITDWMDWERQKTLRLLRFAV